MELYEILKEYKGKKIDEKLTLMEDKLVKLTSCPTNERNVLSRSLRHFKTSFKQKWVDARYTDERFLKSNENWLKTALELPSWSHKPGRPVKEFHELSERSKRRRTEELRAQIPVEELTFAACVSQGTSGNSGTSKIIKEITSTPTRAKKFRNIISTKKDHVVRKYTPQEALSLFVEGNFVVADDGDDEEDADADVTSHCSDSEYFFFYFFFIYLLIFIFFIHLCVFLNILLSINLKFW